MSWDGLSPYVTALAIGLLLGFEREWSHREGKRQAAGTRTFALAALAGALAASMGVGVIAVGLAAVTILVAIGYNRTSAADPGATTEMAAVATYLLGALAFERPATAVAVAVVVAALLHGKERLHLLARRVVTEVELEDAIRFLVVAFVVLPLLPDQDLGPYGALNPRHVWEIVVLLTGIGWVGYIGVRTLGAGRGLLVTGLAGGFVSASATTASMGRLARTMRSMRAPLGGALLASLATLLQLVFVLWFVDAEVVRLLWPTVLASGVVLVVVAMLQYRATGRSDREGQGDDGEVKVGRPFALLPAVALTAILTGTLLVAQWGSEALGDQGAIIASGLAGLADAHAGALSAATLAHQGDIGTSTAILAIAASLGVNTVVKCGLAFTTGGRAFGRGFTLAVLPGVVVFGVGVALTVGLA